MPDRKIIGYDLDGTPRYADSPGLSIVKSDPLPDPIASGTANVAVSRPSLDYGVNAKTGQPLGPNMPMSEVEPVVGARQVIGAQGTAVRSVMQRDPQMAAKAVNDAVEGAFKIGAPLILPALVEAPFLTPVLLTAATAAQDYAVAFAQKQGWAPEYQRLAGNAAALVFLGIGAKGVSNKAFKLGESVGKFYRGKMEVLPAEPVAPKAGMSAPAAPPDIPVGQRQLPPASEPPAASVPEPTPPPAQIQPSGSGLVPVRTVQPPAPVEQVPEAPARLLPATESAPEPVPAVQAPPEPVAPPSASHPEVPGAQALRIQKRLKEKQAARMLYRGQTADGSWYTPDRDAATEYANLDEGGKVVSRPLPAGKVAEREDILAAAQAVGANPDQSLYWLLSPEASDDAPRVIQQLVAQGFEAAHLPEGEDFAPSGKAIESYFFLPKPVTAPTVVASSPLPSKAEAEKAAFDAKQADPMTRTPHPDRTINLGRGMHDPARVIFGDPLDKQVFMARSKQPVSAGGFRHGGGGMLKNPEVAIWLENKLRGLYPDADPVVLRTAMSDYIDTVKAQAKALPPRIPENDPHALDIRPQTFRDFLAERLQPPPPAPAALTPAVEIPTVQGDSHAEPGRVDRGGAEVAGPGGSAEGMPAPRARRTRPAPPPDPADELWPGFLADARENGWTGTDAELRSIFDGHVAEAHRAKADIEGDTEGFGGEALLRFIARNGGIGHDPQYPGEIAQLWEADPKNIREQGHNRVRSLGNTKTQFFPSGRVGGVAGVLRYGKPKWSGNLTAPGGWTLESMRERLAEDGRFGPMETINDLLDAIDAAQTAHLHAKPGTKDLEYWLGAPGVAKGRQWWKPQGEVVGSYADVPDDQFRATYDAVKDLVPDPNDANEVDLHGAIMAEAKRRGWDQPESEPVSEPTAEVVDILPTGEAQPRLPGAEGVREQNISTPELDVPFSLSPNKGPKAKAVETPSLLSSAPQDDLAWQMDEWLEKNTPEESRPRIKRRMLDVLADHPEMSGMRSWREIHDIAQAPYASKEKPPTKAESSKAAFDQKKATRSAGTSDIDALSDDDIHNWDAKYVQDRWNGKLSEDERAAILEAFRRHHQKGTSARDELANIKRQFGAAPRLTYDEFAKAYAEAFRAMSKYTDKEVGSQVYLEKMATLADDHPEFLERFEAEQDAAQETRAKSKAEAAKSDFEQKKVERARARRNEPKPHDPDVLAEYYKPGAIVPSYGGYDRVLAFHPSTPDKSWSVDVIAVEKDGTPIKGEQPRRHFTSPDSKRPETKAAIERARAKREAEKKNNRRPGKTNDQARHTLTPAHTYTDSAEARG